MNRAIIPRMEQPDNEGHKANAAKTIDDMVRKHPHKRQKGDELKRQLKLRAEEYDKRKKATAEAQEETAGKQSAERAAQKGAKNEQQVAEGERRVARDEKKKEDRQIALKDVNADFFDNAKPEVPGGSLQGTKAAGKGPDKPRVASSTDKAKEAAGKPDGSNPTTEEPKKPGTRQAALVKHDAPKLG